jgi:hypothetical protein
VNWAHSVGGSRGLLGVTYGNGIFVAVGRDGTVVTSPDSLNWTLRNSRTTNDLNGITYGNGLFVAVGRDGTVVTSPDSLYWTLRNSRTTNDLNGITYGNATFVAVGKAGSILTSPDGMEWIERISGTTDDLNGIIYGNGTFVAVGNSGAIVQSDSLTGNNPPSKPELIYPAHYLHNLGTEVTFVWKKSIDPDGNPVTYDLYVCEDMNFTGCNPMRTAFLYDNRTIASIGGYASVLFLTGIVISTCLQRRRKIRFLIASLGVAGMCVVSCGGGGGGAGGGVSDEVSQRVVGLSAGKTYYWKVVASDDKGTIAESEIRSFSTK